MSDLREFTDSQLFGEIRYNGARGADLSTNLVVVTARMNELRAEFGRRVGNRDEAVRELRSILGDGDCAYNEDTKDFIEAALRALGEELR